MAEGSGARVSNEIMESMMITPGIGNAQKSVSWVRT